MNDMTRIIQMRSHEHQQHAAALVFEYLVATLAEAGRSTPADVDHLPPVLRDECHDLATAYQPPGVLLLAYQNGQPIACLGLKPHPPANALELRRLYVRPTHRRTGVASQLVNHAHHHAAQHGFSRLILDVLPSRSHVIEFYHRHGYTKTEPFATEAPDPMIYMHRTIAPQ
jgi:GNAT superfamily N-acetyltransferase